MLRENVESSNLAEVGYDPVSETLEVMFHSGGVYQYYNVPQFEYDRMMEAVSIGTYFNREVKGNYPEQKI